MATENQTAVRSAFHPDVESYEQVNRDAMRLLTPPGKGYLALLGMSVMLVGLLVFSELHNIIYGLGMIGDNWAVMITTFVFWVGIGHAGTLISAILYLFRAPWRQAIYRFAEAMTVFAVLTAALFPLLHIGRPWFFYWLLPLPSQRGIWPNFRSPLLWDVFAVTTYLTVSSVFFYIGLIPDIAAARDSTTHPMRKKVYGVLSLGWRGTDREWRHFTRAYLFLAALATPLVLSVHSVVSWDFAVSIVPGWHTTIFAPYFVAGAILSGVAMVVTLMVPVHKIFRLGAYFTPVHYDRLAKLLLLTSCIVGYAYGMEYFMAYYSGELYERDVFWDRVTGDYWWAGWSMITFNAIVPQLLWIKRIRQNLNAFFIISVFVNIGMWYERFVIIVPSLSHSYEPWKFWNLHMTWVDAGLLMGSFGWFFMWFLLFLRYLPGLSMAEIKEVLPPPMKHQAAEHHAHDEAAMVAETLPTGYKEWEVR
ncbi:MAG TPA: NrfD/PsrC family molybdoenzyme membrane anchor subunit [Longimicrobium sp.]|jgi:molybdopterin-containing oxidoreductase family membrane subunit|uniref:NrfD/PsrC family molybdoenzyme membrane anchor subunit n=1 Tax=Longimicrobium sp. TaxID=2029185 RepID=UPI002EDAAD03